MGLTPTFRDEIPSFFLFRPLQRRVNRSVHVARKADDFRRKDGRWEDSEMNRTHLIACLAFCLVLFIGCAAPVAPHGVMRPLSTVPALAEVRSGVYIVVRPSEASPRTSVATENTLLLTQDRRIYVRAPKHCGGATELAIAELKAHRNNVYAMAVNTTGISHATVAIRRGGRVFLQTGITPGDQPAVIAMRPTPAHHSPATDKSGDPRLARSD